MTYTIASSPSNCVDQQRRAGRNCKECYLSQTRNGQWHGNKACWNARCLEAQRIKLS